MAWLSGGNTSGSLEVNQEVEGGGWVVCPTTLVEVSNDERSKVVVKLGDVGNSLKCSGNAGYVVNLERRSDGDGSIFSATLVCPALLVKVSKGDLAAVESLERVVMVRWLIGVVNEKLNEW